MRQKTHLPFRLNLIFFIIFLLFGFLIIQLGIVQILKGEEAQRVIDTTDESVSLHPVPRGFMYDRYGNLLVDNLPRYAITYTPPKNVQPQDKLEIAQTLAKYIQKEPESITERDQKDYWILTRREDAFRKLTDEEREKMDDKEEYITILDRITEEDLSFSKEELEIIAIKRELDLAVEFTPYIIKNEGVTEAEYAKVAEHVNEMPGINVSIDWKRHAPYGTTFRNFIGNLTEHKDGLPQEELDYYLTRQYSLNDRVGESFLEKQYETVLKGKKNIYQHVTDKQENVIDTKLIQKGEQGKSLVLTVDIELQKKVDEIVQEELLKAIQKDPKGNKYLQDAMVVMMNPKNGEVLAMSAMRYYRELDDEAAHFKDESYRTVYDAHLPGSAIKGATVLAGFDSGVIEEDTYFHDEPIKIKGTPEKSSWTDLGDVNYLTALERSSNVFMFYIAMRMGGDYSYVYDEGLDYNPDSFRQMRNYFKQFGLGVETGIDLPYEATGLQGDDSLAGYLMDYAIGQYEPFTTLQLAQYISTIANDGYRIRPHLVKEIRYPSQHDHLGPIYQTIQPEVLNRIEMDDEYLEKVQYGLYQVVHGSRGTGSALSALPYDVAAKTGTAQHLIYENGQLVEETENLTLVGYAPFDDPEIAFAIVVPRVGLDTETGINLNIGRRILTAYFDR
ncbi:peptidoglycan D,D-transpeptidase FtsI family protein [Salirhabdus sp. Marseille-P4669]|uniref:peptidoglycan D,D-transpeptidase FtsI family protein n=1 Tax=Salirhabdus sp. Marseille-P4669 TaxID=2042310 RepID=UPI001F37CCC0|nr:penicillin-binding protein 2 [Salirhabdus sp. Marseille-P4669]